MKFSFPPKLFLIIITVFFIRIAISTEVVQAAQQPLDNISIDTTLDASDTYTVDGTAYVLAGATLTIPAGTHFIFTAGSQLIVDGTLAAKGTISKHIVIAGGVIPPFIPTAKPLVVPVVQSVPVPAATETPDVSETESIDAAPLVVSNTVMLAADATAPVKFAGIRFDNGSSTLSYVDIQDATNAVTVDANATVTIGHSTFTDCDTAILGVRGALHLTNSTFTNVTYPAQLDFHGVFTHSGNTFSNDMVSGWQMGGDVLSGETMKLNSTDGEYDITSSQVAAGGSVVISAGVTIFLEDAGLSDIEGKFTANGTVDKPITFHGDGTCSDHAPAFAFKNTGTVTIGHAIFNDVCNGITASKSTLTMTNDSFNTIAGPAISATNFSTVNASTITMNDVYQAFDITDDSDLNLSDATISLVNGKDGAIQMVTQSAFSANTVSIDTASTCIDVSDNSSMNAKDMTLSHCSLAGIHSDDNTTNGPSGFTLTDSEISDSGIAMDLTGAQVTDVSNNKFHDNTVGISLHHMPVTTLINNWWGSNSGPTIASNLGGIGDSIVTSDVTDVIYRPWIGMSTAAHNPIIIVPGITGSVLTKDYGDDSELWPNIPQLALSPTDSFLDDLELLQDGTPSAARPLTVGDIIRSAPDTDVFDGLIATLLQDGYKEGVDLFVMPYDWRLSNTTTQAQLTGVIANALKLSGKTKVNIIAHSMGGLLLKDYIAQNPTAPIDNLFFIATPNLGAPKAFKALMYGDDMGFNFSLLGALTIHVLNPDRIKIITQNMPSVYELLPSKKYIDEFGSYVEQSAAFLSSGDTTSLMEQAGRNAAMFPFAETLHDATDSLDLSGIPTYNFVGCGETKTIGKIVLTKKESLTSTGMQLTDAYRLQYAAGDGTVPVNSAAALNGATTYFVNAGSHGTLPSTTPVETAIAAILNGTTPDATTGISTAPSSCALSGDIVEIHSPVTLDIYDDQGRHTGPTADGDIEYGIPNVDYETIGDDKFAFLPTGPTYTIVNHAQAIGSYDMYISHSADDDTITNQQYFHEIPLNTLKATGTITISPDYDPSLASYGLSMDEDGDGDYESMFYPVSNYGPQYISDVPPITTASVDSNDMVTLSAQDSIGNPVLNTKYSIDTIHWNDYSAPFQVSSNTTVQFLSIDRAGNVEDIKQLVIPAATTDTPPAATETPATIPVAVAIDSDSDPSDSGSTTYYNNTTINEPAATTANSTDSANADSSVQDSASPSVTTPDDDADQDTADDTDASTPDQTATDDDTTTPTPDIPAPAAVTPSSAVIAPETAAPNQSTIPSNTSDSSATDMNTIAFSSASRKKILPTELLASAAVAVPNGGGIVIAILCFGCIILLILIRKRFSRKKS